MITNEEMQQSCMLPGPPPVLVYASTLDGFIGPSDQPTVGLILNTSPHTSITFHISVPFSRVSQAKLGGLPLGRVMQPGFR